MCYDVTVEYYVYLLKDPRCGTPRYVGMGTGDRAYKHARNNKKEWKTNKRKCEWIQELIDLGLEPTVELISVDSVGEAFSLEKELIARYRRLDYDGGVLLNHCTGGEGLVAGYKLPPQMRQRQSEAHFKLRDDPSYVHPSKGRIVSESEKEKIREGLKGKDLRPRIYTVQEPDGTQIELFFTQINDYCHKHGLTPSHVKDGTLNKNGFLLIREERRERKDIARGNFFTTVLKNKQTGNLLEVNNFFRWCAENRTTHVTVKKGTHPVWEYVSTTSPRYPMSEEQKAKMSQQRRGKKRSSETNEKIIAANRGREHSPETAEKIRNALKGKVGKPTTLRNRETGDVVTVKSLTGWCKEQGIVYSSLNKGNHLVWEKVSS